jgi:hypothetical protein
MQETDDDLRGLDKRSVVHPNVPSPSWREGVVLSGAKRRMNFCLPPPLAPGGIFD